MNTFTTLFVLFLSFIAGACTIIKNPTINFPTLAPTASPAPTVDETGIIKTTIKQALVAKHGDTANELTITVSKINGDYSSGGASASGGGGMWFAAKVNGVWQLVWDGNGSILCSDLVFYSAFPSSMIPECYDSKNNKVIIR